MSSTKQLAASLSLSLIGSAVWAQADTANATQTAQSTTESLPEIVVKAPKKEAVPDSKQHYQAVTTTAGKGKQALKDIPQSVTVVTEKLMDDKNADTLKAAMHTVSGIAFEAGEGGAIGDLIRLRGFTTRSDIFLDGMRDMAQYNRDTFNQDRLEVLRGSASMLYGRGSTGGIINQVSKQPYLASQNEIEATVGTDNYLRLTGDFNVKTGDDAAFRVNVMKTDAESSRNGPETHRIGIAPTFSWGIGTANEFSIGAYHLSYKDTPDYGFAWLNGRPVDAAAERWYGFDSDYQNDSANYMTLSHIHRFSNGGELKTQYRNGFYKRDLWSTTTSLAPNNHQTSNRCAVLAGQTAQRPTSINDSTVLCHGGPTRGANDHHQFLQSDYSGKADWFGYKQDILAGIELTSEKSSAFSYNTSKVVKPFDLFGEPGSNPAVLDNRIKNPATQFKAQTLAIYGQDTVSLTNEWKLMGGVRYDNFDAKYERTTTDVSTRVDSLFSHRFGVLYQPNEDSSYYASKGTSFNTSGDLYQFDRPQGQQQDSSKTPAEESLNIEMGAKWSLLQGDLALRTALFRTEKTNERNTDLDQASGAYLLSGRRHTDGIEFEAAGRINERLEVFGGIAYMLGRIDEAGSTGQDTVGKVSGLTPRRSGNIWATYQINDHWRVGMGADGMSGRVPAAGEASGNRAPGYVKADALIEYTTMDYKVKLNLNNLFDKVYVDGVYRGFTVWGPTRGAQLSLAKTF